MVCAILCQEFGKSIDEVGRMTRHQFATVYQRRLRDDQQRLIYPDDKPAKPVSWEQEWRTIGLRRAWPEWRIEAWIAVERLRRAAKKTAKKRRR